MQNNFEYYKQLVIEMAINPDVVTVDDISDIKSAPAEERTKLALFLLAELGGCWEAIRVGKSSWNSHELFTSLIGEFMDSEILSYEDFAYVASNGSLFMVGCMLYNDSYPLDLLVDYVYLQDDDSGSEDLGLLGFPNFKSILESFREYRIKEVASFLRKRIPDSKSLTDEMVLNIAGVAFTRR